MKEVIYLANYSKGTCDDWYQVTVFASKDKETVEKWVNKFNTKLAHWKEYFKQFSDDWCEQCLAEKYWTIENLKFYDIMEINEAYIDEIEIR